MSNNSNNDGAPSVAPAGSTTATATATVATATGSYQRVASSEEGDSSSSTTEASERARASLRNFLLMAVLFSANHGCVVSCLGLASSRLGSLGAWQSGILYLTYSASSVTGATYVAKTLGARNAMTLGMACYCGYVGCFYVATRLTSIGWKSSAGASVVAGAVLGGIGAGFLWTAQGAYFGLAGKDRAALLAEASSSSGGGGGGTSEEEAEASSLAEASNATLAGYFAFLYLAEELVLRLLSSVLAEFGFGWESIFGVYTLVTVGSTLAMPLVHDYPRPDDDDNDGDRGDDKVFRKATVAARLLREDPKMKHMIGLNAAFGFASAFLNSYVNGQVLPVSLNDPDSRYVGVLTSTVAIVAAGMSLVFGRLGGRRNNNNNDDDANDGGSGTNSNGIILILGALCFGGVVLPFAVQPDAAHYGWKSLLAVYCLHGTGRATFEGTLRSTFADYFSREPEGAFANIILQNGIASGIGYILTFALTCETPSKYCIEYRDGSLHDVWTFEAIALGSVVLAIGGYLRASNLHRRDQQQRYQHQQFISNGNGVSA